MEFLRKLVNYLFWLVFIGGTLFLIVMLVGGAFPININPQHQKVKFDLAYIGWEMNDPSSGTFKIVHDEKNVKEGFGSLEYTYKVKRGYFPGFRSKAISMEGITSFTFLMKSKYPGTWQLQIKRKSDSMIFPKTFSVGPRWEKYFAGVFDMKHEIGYKGNVNQVDFQPWINFIDVTTGRSYKENTIWIDCIDIER